MMKNRHITYFIFILLILSIPLSTQMVDSKDFSETGVRIFVEKGPTDVFINETAKYKVRIGGSFGDSAENWTLKTSVDVQARIDRRDQNSNKSNVFTVNITFRKTGSAKITFEAYCGKGGEVRYSKDNLKIDAEKPVTTTVKIQNPTDYELSGIKVGLFVDGKLKNITNVDKLGADEKKSVTMKWSKEGYSSGEHNVEIWVDYRLGGAKEFSKEQKVLDKTFYIEGDSNLGWIIGAIIIAAVTGFFIYYFYSKGKSRRRKPWKK